MTRFYNNFKLMLKDTTAAIKKGKSVYVYGENDGWRVTII